MVLHESRDITRRRPQPPPRRDGLERDPKLAYRGVEEKKRNGDPDALVEWWFSAS